MGVRTAVWCTQCESMGTVRSWSRSSTKATDHYGTIPLPETARALRCLLCCGHRHRYVITLANLGAISMTIDSSPGRLRWLQRAMKEARDGKRP